MGINLNNQNIIITGCNGQIGTKLCEQLNNQNFNIFGIDYLSKNNYLENFYFYECDLTDNEKVNSTINDIYKKVKNIDCLIHLAGIDYKVRIWNK